MSKNRLWCELRVLPKFLTGRGENWYALGDALGYFSMGIRSQLKSYISNSHNVYVVENIQSLSVVVLPFLGFPQ